ncbi:hypothetical protein AIOL_001800 [Candidatus Rhodobacter oscarellae]|uniref:SH3b domain-containing protein n=1 Tax=Candidatus Rhodobacter oscarellae TaxID=1675527 RepID=A0A0J9GTL5_9RHOB|nr:SH3 domain-containing protein [Candidatus Rhodobacter lobularis]KMW56843.1 hypothetical protein AIOL_001800 [Candidatus Rhodobacter lobularis]
MRTIFLALLTAFLPLSLAAQPAYFRVTGVAANDSLNVRAEPRSSSADIGDLPAHATGVEVHGTDASGKWGRIIWQEGLGWVSMRFLAPDPVQRVPGTELPAGLLCAGTEPFWSLQLSASSAAYSDANDLFLSLGLTGTRVAAGRPSFPVQVSLSGGGGSATLLVRPSACSDGMSDRAYPWHVDLLLDAGGIGAYYDGCCHLPLEAGSQ